MVRPDPTKIIGSGSATQPGYSLICTAAASSSRRPERRVLLPARPLPPRHPQGRVHITSSIKNVNLGVQEVPFDFHSLLNI